MISGAAQKKPWWVLVVFLAVLICVGYILTSQVVFGIGFPLDDAWIHQTYARNLAQFGEWSFIPGQLSAGSTAPLWSMLLSIGYLLGLAPYWWTYLLGALCLAVLAITGEKWSRILDGSSPRIFPLVGIFLLGEWHLVWAAASGMETILFGLVILAVFLFLAVRRRDWITGALIGLSIWIRPDGLTLLGPALFQTWLESKSWLERIKRTRDIGLPFSIGLAAYLVFNQLVSNTWLPNTFYAKQTEYAVYQHLPFLERFFSLFSLPMVGAGIFLLPGFVYFIWKSIRNRNWNVLGASMWWAGYTLIYILRLPVVYQHGRYLIPAMPVFFVLGLAGLFDSIPKLRCFPAQPTNKPGLLKRLQRSLSVGWATGVGSLWLVMLFIGAFTYAQDVAIIQTEMVTTARWISQNTPQDALIGAHDIGALGFFGNRKILDLAGLISPQVIPIIRNEPALKVFLDQNKADYLMTFPSWYSELAKGATPVFTTSGKFSPDAGGENMTVYKWP